MARELKHEPLLTPGEVAAYFRVDPKTVARWAKAGRLKFIWTPGGARRYPEREIQAWVEQHYTLARATPKLAAA